MVLTNCKAVTVSEDNINNGLCTLRIFSKWNLLVSARVHDITVGPDVW